MPKYIDTSLAIYDKETNKIINESVCIVEWNERVAEIRFQNPAVAASYRLLEEVKPAKKETKVDIEIPTVDLQTTDIPEIKTKKTKIK